MTQNRFENVGDGNPVCCNYSYHFCLATGMFQVVDPSPMIPHEILRNLGLIFFFPMDDGIDFRAHTHTYWYKHADTDSSMIHESEITSVMTMAFAVNAGGMLYA